MKRTATAALAAATALSIVAAPAFAEDNTAANDNAKAASSAADIVKSSQKDGDKQDGSAKDEKKSSFIKGSSDIKDDEAMNYYKNQSEKQSALLKRVAGDKSGDELNAALKPLLSSIKADKAQEWNPGTTLNILLGVGVLAALVGIANAGMIPGLSLPNIALPF